jgi:putative endonuclease
MPRMNADYIVYILRCSDGSLYTGITNDPAKRLAAHNAGTGAKYTRPRRPVEMVYAERAEDRSAASKREAEIKSYPREKKLALIESDGNAVREILSPRQA